MVGKQKHMERSKRSYHSKPDFADFHKNATLRTAKKVNESLIGTILGAFKRQKKGDK